LSDGTPDVTPCGENFPHVVKGARGAPGAWWRGSPWAHCRPPESGCERSGLGWQAGAMRPRGLSPLPVRPLRLSPITAGSLPPLRRRVLDRLHLPASGDPRPQASRLTGGHLGAGRLILTPVFVSSSVGLAACRRGTSHHHRGLTDLPAQVSQAIDHTASLSVAHGPRTPSAERRRGASVSSLGCMGGLPADYGRLRSVPVAWAGARR
jgi:hypothetical protein